MIEITQLLWLVAGLSAGLIHASMLWRNVHALSAWSPWIGFTRLGLVAALLVVAALEGEILCAAAGWAVGFTLLAAWFMTRGNGGAIKPGDASQANQGLPR